MPIVKISAEDLKASVRIQPGWYKAIVKECKPEPSSDKKSINYNFYFRVDDNGNERVIKHGVNSDRRIMASFLPPILIACLSTEAEPFKVDKDSGQDLDFDTDLVAGKRLWIKFESEPYQGNLISKPKVFMPIFYDPTNSPF